MPNGFPCPNPTCTHLFPADAVKGTAELTCPRCGTIFRFRNQSTKASAAAKSSTSKAVPQSSKKAPPPWPAKIPPPPPPAKAPPPVAPVVPLAGRTAAPAVSIAPAVAPPVVAPDLARPSGLEFGDSANALVSPRDKRKRRKSKSGLLAKLVMVFVVLGALGGAVWLVREYLPVDSDEEQERVNKSQGNFAFKAPSGWKPDVNLRGQIHVNLALSRRKPRTHMALFYRDYKTRAPGDEELIDVALRKLRDYFRQLDYESKGQTGQLGGEPALVLDFASEGSEVPMRGQCFILRRQGYAYWLFTWGPDESLDELQPRWEKLREGFKLLNEREGWRPQPRKTIEFTGAGYVLKYVTEVWRKEENAKDYDERAELALRGFEPIENEETGTKKIDEYAGKAATVQVLVLERKGDLKAAVAAALEHVRKRMSELYPDIKIEPAKDKKTDKPLVSAEVGKLRGQVSKLRLKLDPDTEKYGVLAVVNRPEGVLAIFCECKWDRQAYWEGEFKALLETLKGKLKGG